MGLKKKKKEEKRMLIRLNLLVNCHLLRNASFDYFFLIFFLFIFFFSLNLFFYLIVSQTANTLWNVSPPFFNQISLSLQ